MRDAIPDEIMKEARKIDALTNEGIATEDFVDAIARALMDRDKRADPDFAKSIAEVCKEEGLNGAACGWRSCTGCHEITEGVPQGVYSPTFKTHVGIGCSECGGLGVVWEYWTASSLEEMARGLDTAILTYGDDNGSE